MLMIKLADFTESIYSFFYRDTALQIMERPAAEVRDLKAMGTIQNFNDQFLKQQYKKIKALMRARISTYNGGTKVTYSAVKVMKYDIKAENRNLLDRLELYEKKDEIPDMMTQFITYDMNQEANFHGNGGINKFFGSSISHMI